MFPASLIVKVPRPFPRSLAVQFVKFARPSARTLRARHSGERVPHDPDHMAMMGLRLPDLEISEVTALPVGMERQAGEPRALLFQKGPSADPAVPCSGGQAFSVLRQLRRRLVSRRVSNSWE